MIFAYMITPAAATILAAVIVATAGVIVAIIQQFRTQHKVDVLHDSLKTNNGKRPGEYLELVGELDQKVDRMETAVATIAQTVADHTLADGVNFEQIQSAQAQMDKRIAASAEAAITAVNAANRANLTAKNYHDQVMAEIQSTKQALCGPLTALGVAGVPDPPPEEKANPE